MGNWNPWGGVAGGAAGAPHDVGLLWGPASLGNPGGVTADSDYDLDAANEAIATVFVVPKDGNITDIGFYIAVTAGAFPDYYVSLDTVNVLGQPTGVRYGGSAQTEFTPAGGAEHRWITLGTQAVAAAGDLVAVIVGPGVDAPSAGNEIAILNSVMLDDHGLPHAVEGVPWSLTGGINAVAVKYDDGTVVGLSAISFVGETFDSADTPDEMGCKFTLPMDAKCNGARVAFNSLAASTSYQVKLYNSVDALIASATIGDEDYQGGWQMADVFWDEVSLTADATYRLTILATHATATVTPFRLTFPDAASRNWMPEGAAWTGTERTDAGGWTDEALEQGYMALWLTSITV